ncbi:MAG: hypothetical protein ACTHKB_09970 [Burkholderiaceae bacterium]
MRKHLLLTMSLLACALPAHAVYRCESPDGSTVGYRDTPCPHAKSVDLGNPAAPTASPADAAASRAALDRDRRELHRLEATRHKEEKEQARREQAAARAQKARDAKCRSLALRRKWAEEDAAEAGRSSSGTSAARARKKSRRLGEQYALACDG